MSLLKKNNLFRWALLLGLAFVLVGCDKEKAKEIINDSEKALEKTGDAIADGANKAAEKGGEIASQLGQQAMAWMSPLKEKFGDLDSLKESPEKLKTAVTGLIKTIEDKAEGIKLPESMSNALSSIKEKLVALKDYLGGKVEQAKIDEHVKGIIDAVKSKLGFSGG